ncbi:hypothetical protein DFJ74DRAFT_760230 [Hyaloraphidium curvatum]|nr:hypothetical protein DFJ74DRAFT_760230 [Hyaloraphidium curvatum]
MAHTHSHAGGGGHDHAHGGGDVLADLVGGDAVAAAAAGGLRGADGLTRAIAGLDAAHAGSARAVDGAWRALSLAVAAGWARDAWRGRTKGDALPALLRICFPAAAGPEALLAASYAATLTAKTFAGVRVAAGEAAIVELVLGAAPAAVSHSAHSAGHSHSHGISHGHSHGHASHGHGAAPRGPLAVLAAALARHLLVDCLPLVVLSGLLSLIERTLASRFRTRLTEHLSRRYLLGRTGGRPNLHAVRAKIPDPGARIYADADRFAKGLADVGGCLVGPFVDLVGFAWAAWTWLRGRQNSGGPPPRNPLLQPAIFLILLTARHLPSAPWSQLTSSLRRLESLRAHAHALLARDAEPIALLNQGGPPRREMAILAEREAEHDAFEDYVERERAREERWEGWIVGDLWGALGMLVPGWNVFASAGSPDPHHGHSHHAHGHSVAASHECEHDHDHDAHGGGASALEVASHRAAAFLESRALLASAADAAARLLHAKRELLELEGSGERLAEMARALESPDAVPGAGVVSEGTEQAVEFDGTDVVAPVGEGWDAGEQAGGEVLVRGLTFRWERGMNILVRGPNGSGKSSLLRILAGLWPAEGVYSPGFAARRADSGAGSSGIHLTPQRVYLLPELDLLSNILYPAAVPSDPDELRALHTELKGYLDLLSMTHLAPYLDPSSPLSSLPIGNLHLPPSATHRLALLRPLLARPAPAFAVLDEAASALRTRAEELAFWAALAKRGTSVAVVSHGQVWGAEEGVFTHRLEFRGRGAVDGEWVFERIGEGKGEAPAGAADGDGPSSGSEEGELLAEFSEGELEALRAVAAEDEEVARLVEERAELEKRLRNLAAVRKRRDELAVLVAGLR